MTFRQVTTEVNTLGQDLSKLSGTIQNEISALHKESIGLVTTIDATGKSQLEFQQKFQSEMKAMSDAVGLIKQNQAELEKRIELVHSTATAISNDTPVVIEQPKAAAVDNGQRTTVRGGQFSVIAESRYLVSEP